MDPNNIQEITQFHDTDDLSLTPPSIIDKYKLSGQTTKIAHTTLDVRDVVCKGRFGPAIFHKWGTRVNSVCVKEIKIEWNPHVELNHVAFMNVKVQNVFTTDQRSRRSDIFLEGLFPIHVHWAIAISSPRWITTEKFMCYSPWSYTITARNMPQEALERAGEMTVSYVIEKGHKHKESAWMAPVIIIDPIPFPYMIPFYKYRSPGGLYESNMTIIKGVVNGMRLSLKRLGVNDTITDGTIWALSNTINASMQRQMIMMDNKKDERGVLEIVEKMIHLLTKEKNPGYPPYDHITALAEDALGMIISKEISGLGDELGASCRY